jgi:hypothetical protein
MNEAEQKQVDGYLGMVSEKINASLVPLDAQIKCAVRELGFRTRVYPRWIQQKKMTAQISAHELACMRAIIDTLQQVARGERLI